MEFKPFWPRRRLARQWLLQAATNNTAIKGENRFKPREKEGEGQAVAYSFFDALGPANDSCPSYVATLKSLQAEIGQIS